MPQAYSRSLCLALGRLRFAIVTSCWVIALCLIVQLIVWSLATFTDLRYTDEAVASDEKNVPLIVHGNDKPARRAASGEGSEKRRWRPDSNDAQEEEVATGMVDRIFNVAVSMARAVGLMCALLICPLLSMGMLLAVPAGAPKVERAVNALIWAVVLVMLAMPLGGWFGLAWQQGTITDYGGMVYEVESARTAGLTTTFYSRFLLLPAATAVGFILVGIQFNSAVVAVLLKRDMLDPELEAEASGVAATSLHGTGRTAGALSRALESERKKKMQKKTSPSSSMTRMSPGEMPKRLI